MGLEYPAAFVQPFDAVFVRLIPFAPVVIEIPVLGLELKDKVGNSSRPQFAALVIKEEIVIMRIGNVLTSENLLFIQKMLSFPTLSRVFGFPAVLCFRIFQVSPLIGPCGSKQELRSGRLPFGERSSYPTNRKAFQLQPQWSVGSFFVPLVDSGNPYWIISGPGVLSRASFFPGKPATRFHPEEPPNLFAGHTSQ